MEARAPATPRDREERDPTPKAPFSFDDYDHVIGFVVSQAGHRLSKGLADIIAEVGSDIRPREFAILNRLHQYGALTQTQVAALTYRDGPATSRMLDRLMARGLVVRKSSERDRRAVQVSLTEAGEALRRVIVPRTEAMLQRACAGIAPDALATTVDTLQRIVRQIG